MPEETCACCGAEAPLLPDVVDLSRSRYCVPCLARMQLYDATEAALRAGCTPETVGLAVMDALSDWEAAGV